MGVPYFKFFVIFREIPIFEKTEEEVLNSEKLEENGHEDSLRNRLLANVIGTEFRLYVEHF